MLRRLLSSCLVALALVAPTARAQDDGLPPPRPTPAPAPDGDDEPEEEEPEEPSPPDAPPATPPKPLPPAPPPAPPGQGRVRFSREQGAAEQLQTQLTQALAALKGGDATALGEALRTFKPSEAALRDAFTDEGFKALAPRILSRAPELFEGEPARIAERLNLRPELEQVQVFAATTEDLLTMEAGTDAAREFASGLRRTAEHLKKRYVWYCAVLKPTGPAAEDPTKAARLQLFFFHEGKFVLLGRIWRIEDE